MALVDYTAYRVRYGDGLDREEGAPHVQVAQCLLNKWLDELNRPKIDDDGRYGDGTYETIIAFQQFHALEDDGTIGRDTWAALRVYSTTVNDPKASPPTRVRATRTFMVIDVEGKYGNHVRLFAAAAMLIRELVCAYWRCSYEVIVGTVDEFDPDRHEAILFGDGDGGVPGSLAWHWHGPIQAIFERLGIGITDDDWDPVGWVDMTTGWWDTAAFHELFEMLGNAFVNLVARNHSDHENYWMRENADPTQNDYFSVFVDDVPVRVSNFVAEEWFGDDGETETYGMASDLIGAENLEVDFELGPYDAMGLIKREWEIRPGGYQILVSHTDPNAWSSRFASGEQVDIPAHAARRVFRTPCSAEYRKAV